MAETPSQLSPTQPPPAVDDQDPISDPVQYWCYQCDKRVAVETQTNLHDVVCFECKNGFVESITPAAPSSRTSLIDESPSFGNEFLHVLRLIAQASREDDAPPPPPSEQAADPTEDSDYLRIELDGWDEVAEEDAEGEDEADDEGEGEGEGEVEEDDEGEVGGDNRSDEDEDDEDNEEEDEIISGDADEELEDVLRRRRRAALRLRLRDFATRAASRRNRILDWAEILIGLEDHSIEFRLQVPDMDGYVGNPGDYVDAAGYEALLQNLAENDNGGRRGAPPAAKSAIEALETFEVKLEKDVIVCAICKDSVNVGEVAKMLPCTHGYHGDCIVPWLGSRNTCPVCRHELPTDDPEYEEDKKKTVVTSGVGGAATSGDGGGSSSTGGYID